ncbi:lipopolysaccharide biosynthesis protein [Limobrevibacterium gyesilva]|uniref:Lipopolysaccharide biosynthesis protein n=1 Tax=Limobrevibacterium gyesilva TaxID=2991712 RepID=A0AA42CH70_9PROT|nr:lipopolysaccharide biosynthesis protein [Limobrevibacterium gyesilva]MCW3476926.1 lipopolysaccharide biosynthesis protein [Limobrevibacterium gyesilva]
MTAPATKEPEQRPTSVARGATLMVGMRGVSRFIGVFSAAILARLLTPDDFGIVVLGTSVLNVVQLVSECSLGAALIRMRDPQREHFDTAWTIAVLRGLIIAAVVLASASYVASSMAEPRVEPILWILAATAIVQSFENIRLVEFQIALDFGTVFRYQFITRIVSFLATILLAVVLRSYWALILSSLLTTAIMTIYSYMLRPYRPRLTLSAWREIFGFSKWVVMASFLAVIDSYSINFLMGWFGGARAMGLYQVGYQIAALPASEIAAPIRQPLYAGYAKLLHNRPALAKSYVDGFGFLFFIITPMSLGIFAIADLITPLALGPQWADATPIMQVIVFYALFDAYGHYTHNLFVVMNRQRRQILLYVLFLAVRVPAALYGGYVAGAIGAVYGMAVTAVIGAFFWLGASLTIIEVPAMALWRVVWRTCAACTVMVLVLLPLRRLWPVGQGYPLLALQLLVFTLLGAVVHVGVQLLLWRASGSPEGAESRALGIALGAVRRVFPMRLAPFRS